VKARNEVSHDFMNLPDTRKAMEQATKLDSLLAQGDVRSLDEALSQLGESLGNLRDLLDGQATGFGNARFPQENRALAELSRKLGDLEGDQRQVAGDGLSLAKEVDAELGRRMEARQADFLARAKQKLEQIQRKVPGSVPRELSSSAESATEGARESVRQLRRLLPSREWSEASREAERLVGSLAHLQRASGRSVLQSRSPSPGLLGFESQVGDALGLARELAADLNRLVPRGSDVMSAEQRARTEGLSQRQSSVEERTRGLSRDLKGRTESTPGAEDAAKDLQEIADQMRQAGDDLRQGSAHEGAGRSEEAAQRLARLRQSLGRKSVEGSRASREPVRIPDADASKAPREWRQELMEAMREKAPEKFRDEVRRYYEDLVR
jgi:hypothetical protein